MTANCDRIGAKVAECNVNLHTESQGELQGRDIAALPCYLLVGGAVMGVLATVAITVAAVAFAKLSLIAVVATCSLLCIATIFGAVSLHRIDRTVHALFDRLQLQETTQAIEKARLGGELDDLEAMAVI